MNITKSAAGLASALLAAAILAACGDVQDEGGNGGYAEGWQPGSYVPVSQQRAENTLPMDGWHGQLELDRLGEKDNPTNRYQHQFE